MVEAVDGAEAIRLLDGHRQDGALSLILLDMNLPRVDGVGVLPPPWPRPATTLPVVAISATERSQPGRRPPPGASGDAGVDDHRAVGGARPPG